MRIRVRETSTTHQTTVSSPVLPAVRNQGQLLAYFMTLANQTDSIAVYCCDSVVGVCEIGTNLTPLWTHKQLVVYRSLQRIPKGSFASIFKHQNGTRRHLSKQIWSKGSTVHASCTHHNIDVAKNRTSRTINILYLAPFHFNMKLSISTLLVSGFLIQDGSAFVSGPASRSISRQTSFLFAEEPGASPTENEKPAQPKAIILDPYLPAVDPKYKVTGKVGEGDFILSRSGGPTDEELTDENLYRIIERKASDLEVNTLVWKCLGYRFDADGQEWTPAEVFPKWKDRFPEPPDFIGMQRIYSKEIDGPCLRNNQSLVRSIPAENKASYLKKHMMPFGFTGYKVIGNKPWMKPSLSSSLNCVAD